MTFQHFPAGARAPVGLHLFGDGPCGVLVLHDWNGDHQGWHAVLPYLDTAANTYAFVDLRGYGASRDVAGEYTVDEIAADCLAAADGLGWARFHVVGHSMTGMATQRIAANAPARVASAVAICPMSAAGSQLDAATRAFFASTTHDDDAFRRLLRFVTPGLGAGWIEAKLRHARGSVNPACRDGYLHMFTRGGFVDEVRGLATPFLVLVGDGDPGIDAPAMARTFLAWHPNARCEVLPACGHYPMQERPPLLATVLDAWLAERG